jgi:hypothetical protein
LILGGGFRTFAGPPSVSGGAGTIADARFGNSSFF